MPELYTCPICGKGFKLDISCEDEYVNCDNCGERLRSPCVATLRSGDIVGDYLIAKRIGIGGMGEVYLAEQRSMMRSVALKVLNPDLYQDKTYLERFYREVRTLAQIEHPNVVKAIETGFDKDVCFFSMMYIDGKDMKERLDSSGRIPELDALHVILNVSDALRYVWKRHKIIHRDIKPANIILTADSEVKLMDLGISKIVEKEEQSAGLTLAGMMVGSPYYVSPEQARAEKDIDFRADMYSLGATFYHMLTGQVPFDDDSTMVIIAAHLSKKAPDPRSINSDISQKSARIIARMMEKKKDDRYPSWNEVIEDVEDAIESLSSIGKTTSMLVVPKKLKRKSAKTTSKKTSRKTSRKTSGKTRRSSFSSTVGASHSKPDFQERIRHFLITKFFGNLYARFVFLVVLLSFTLLAFANMVRRGVDESRRLAVSAKYSQAVDQIKEIKRNQRWTREEIRKTRALLITVGRSGDSEYAVLAKKKLDDLKRMLLDIKRKKKLRLVEATLEKLKRESYELEKKDRIREAIGIWREYMRSGPFAIDLKDEISEHIRFLKRKLKISGVGADAIK